METNIITFPRKSCKPSKQVDLDTAIMKLQAQFLIFGNAARDIDKSIKHGETTFDDVDLQQTLGAEYGMYKAIEILKDMME